MIYIHNLDPVIFNLGGFAIRWYGLAYLVGILFGFYIIKSLKKDLLSDQQLEQLVQYTIAGILVGGRLGYCLFYNLSFYFYNPIEIFKIWHGGMSFHGGMIGVVIAAFMFTKKEHIALLKLTDLIVFALPCGLFFVALLISSIVNLSDEPVTQISVLYFQNMTGYLDTQVSFTKHAAKGYCLDYFYF